MKIKPYLQTLTGTMFMVLALVIPAKAISKDSNLEQRLQKLSQAMEQARKTHHIPGMALAIVKDGKTIWAQGYGFSDLETKKPVTVDTLFATGSTGKAFTAALNSLLVAEGLLDWDEPITSYLPEYKIELENSDQTITLRDMLSHRTGHTRNDILWASGKASRDEIMATAIKAKPWDEYQKNFHYNNVMYLAAGLAQEAVTKKNWDQLIKERIFLPLDMKNSTTSFDEAKHSPQMAKGYQWNEIKQANQRLPMRNLNSIAPAGGINANIKDMAQWVKLLLGNGTYKGKEIIDAAALKTNFEPAIKVGGNIHYGMGWFLREWQGMKVLEHGGNIDGFSAQVALLPEKNLGFVLLTNANLSPLITESINMIWSHLLPQKTPTHTQTGGMDYSEYLGEYIGNFASFDGAIFTVLEKNGSLAVDVPGQTTYLLNDPDEDGRWVFQITDTIAVSFDRNDKQQIVALRMHQNRFDFELPRVGMTITPEVDPDLWQPYLGHYGTNGNNGEVEVIIQNQRLTLDVPAKMMKFELYPPDDTGHHQFRIKSDMGLRFDRNENGNIKGLSIIRNKDKVLESALRVQSTPLPSVDELLALRNSDAVIKALKKHSAWQFKGSVSMLNAGVTGEVEILTKGLNRNKLTLDFGQFGRSISVINKGQVSRYTIDRIEPLNHEQIAQAQLELPVVFYDWKKHFDHIQVTGEATVNEQKTYVVKLKQTGLPSYQLWIDAKSGDILKQKVNMLAPGIGSIPIVIEHSNYHEIGGIRWPHKSVMANPMSGQTVLKIDEVLTDQEISNKQFKLDQ